MRHCQYTITRHTVHAYAEQVCQRHIPLKDRGRKCKASVLWAVLFWAARRISSLAAACATLRDAPSDTAAHDALLATLPAFAELSRRKGDYALIGVAAAAVGSDVRLVFFAAGDRPVVIDSPGNVERELVMLAAASHPNIVQLKDHGMTEGYVWLTMPV